MSWLVCSKWQCDWSSRKKKHPVPSVDLPFAKYSHMTSTQPSAHICSRVAVKCVMREYINKQTSVQGGKAAAFANYIPYSIFMYFSPSVLVGLIDVSFYSEAWVYWEYHKKLLANSMIWCRTRTKEGTWEYFTITLSQWKCFAIESGIKSLTLKL